MKNNNFKKKYGQNFLRNENILDSILNSIDINEHDKIIEVGPGDGALTRKLITKTDNVIAFEIDTSLKEYLDELDCSRVTVYYKDFLSVSLSHYLKQKEIFYCVANIPYYITTPIIKKFTDEKFIPKSMVLMVQKEVGERLCSKPHSKEYGAITVLLNYFFNLEYLFHVDKNNFYPVPSVDSAVIKLSSKDEKLNLKNYSIFEKVVNNAFMFKRKTLKNNFKMYDLNEIDNILKKYGYSLGNRAEDINYEVYIEIANYLS